MKNIRGTYAVINLSNIEHNLRVVRSIIGIEKKILLAVKADGYGHGAVEVSKFAESHNLVEYFGVASLEEGIELREAGVLLPVLMLGFMIPTEENISLAIKYDLSISIGSLSTMEKIAQLCTSNNSKCKIHIKIDTGMGRLGVKPEGAFELVRETISNNALQLDGIFSHMPLSDDTTRSFNMEQISLFNSQLSQLSSLYDTKKPLLHFANSGGVMNYPSSIFDMVRVGIMAYGYLPDPYMHSSVKLKPSMSLYSQVQFTKELKPILHYHTAIFIRLKKSVIFLQFPADTVTVISEISQINHM
jgi:alanine racemase